MVGGPTKPGPRILRPLTSKLNGTHAANVPTLSIYDHAREKWDPSRFSDPRAHDPKNFRYLIHAVPQQSWASRAGGFLREAESRLFEGWMSGSVVANGNVNVYLDSYTRFALILEVPKANIFAATPFDMQSRHRKNYWRQPTLEYLDMLQKRHGIKHPEELLQSTGLNEVAFAVGEHDSKIRIKGIAIIAAPEHAASGRIFANRDEAENTHFLAEVRAAAAERNWPVVVIPRT